MSKEKDNNSALDALESLRMRLLDLTARNRLINFRHSKKGSLRIIDELPDQLAETLLSETEMNFLSVPEPDREELIAAGYLQIDEQSGQEISLKKDPTAVEWAKYLGLSTAYEVPQIPEDAVKIDDKHSDKAIQTLLFPYELETRLKNLSQMAESAIQEMGANILYLSFGFLEWYDNNNDKARIAPLFLVPMRLHKGRLNSRTKTYEFTLSYSGEDIISNLSLKEKLRADFSMALPELNEYTTPEAYFKDVRSLIEDNQPAWRVRRYISFGLFNFSKLLMYLDLDPLRWSATHSSTQSNRTIVDHPVTSLFLSGYDAGQKKEADPASYFGAEHLIDEIDDIHVKYPLIDDADSSQHSALIDVLDGKNLVIEGPPGTGKSQTITNLIAAAMSQGKKVLFVAEKLAALEVVRRRLDKLNLGEFCLELHSHKSQKRKVLDDIDERIKKHGSYRSPDEMTININRYEELKTGLKEHVERINRPWKNTGKTLHEIFMAAICYREAVYSEAKQHLNPELFHPEGYDGNNFDRVTQQRMADQVDAYGKLYQVIINQLDDNATLHDHPWYGVRNANLQIFDIEHVTASLQQWQNSLQDLALARTAIINEFSAEPSAETSADQEQQPSDSIKALRSLLHELDYLPVLKGDELLASLVDLRGDVLDDCHQYLMLFEHIQSSYVALNDIVGASVLADITHTDKYSKGCEQLRQLVEPSVELGDLADAMNRLTTIQEQLADLTEPLNEIKALLNDKVAHYFMATEAGLAEFGHFVQRVAALNPSHWKLRDELFDNDELDEILPALEQELVQLKGLNEELKSLFKLDSLPDSEDEFKQLITTLNNGGLCRWFKSSWRAARKQLLSYAAGTQVSFSQLEPVLDSGQKYIRQRKKLTTNLRYQERLGQYLQGLDTDLDALQAVRQWYKTLRQQYGVGFGKKVSIGDAIIELPYNIARGVRSLSEGGIQQQLNNISNELLDLKQVFSPAFKQQDPVLLAGDDSLVDHILSSVATATHACEPLATDKSLSIAQLEQRIEMLNALNMSINQWRTADCDNLLFQGNLGLKLGLHIDNTAALSVLENTLHVADIIEHKISNEILLKFIYDAPSRETFASLQQHTESLRAAISEQDTHYESFAKRVALNATDWMSQSGDYIRQLSARNTAALEQTAALQNWIDYLRIRVQMDSSGFIRLVKNIEAEELDIALIDCAYKAGIYDLLAREIMSEDNEISRFSGHSQKTVQDQFKEYDQRLKKLQCAQIAWKIDQKKIPAGQRGTRVSEHSEKVLLDHECSKKTRHIPLRQLLKRAGEALVALKPCFMMGPMSVAQYLAPGQIEFDLVVMDEASQIKPQDALGAIARGTQLVVVGDPRQLPPTSFFDRVIDHEDGDLAAIEESESILDATLPMFLSRRLRWHYRSQHESLIAFSNHSFYDSNLVIFPSPHKSNENYGIQYSRIPRGCFVNRRNMEEAKIIAQAVREHFQYRPEETLGVVAMSAEQRLQIELAIEQLAKEESRFQQHLEQDFNRLESLFIKNLENVQGDERDVIFVSMTYGPREPEGKVMQRFGPINSDMGWRRLNVLFTRSRKRMHIFSSMDSGDINISSSSKRGVRALGDFLTFCETGIVHKTQNETEHRVDSDFEVSVMSALKKEGFDCISRVGVTGFFIDVAVIDPGNPGRYLMGIECDGATYHSAKSARDRDRLRETVLQRLGWRVHRIWSTDWFKNPEAELRPVIRELNQLKTELVDKDTPEKDKREELSEADDIDEIIEQVEIQEAVTEKYLVAEWDLKSKLIDFDQEVIRKQLPETADNQRLLRPAMLEAFLEYLPCSQAEFTEVMPPYLRQSTDPSEEKYLDNILELINADAEQEISEN